MTVRPLDLCNGLFDRLRTEVIRYSRFKSNEHLLGALTGETDLGVLVDRSQVDRFYQDPGGVRVQADTAAHPRHRPEGGSRDLARAEG
jgi:hypothetical protein